MKILIFDYDGTIADSLDYVCKGFNHAAEQFGVRKRSRKEVEALYLKNIFASLTKIGIPKKKLKEFVWKMREGYESGKIKPFPEIVKSINSLKRNSKIFIITSNFKKTIGKSMNKNKIKVDGILGEEQGISKVRKINLIEKKYPKSEIFYIGDTAGDIKEARKAKAKSVAVTWGFHSRKTLLKSKPDYIISKPKDLIEILK